MQPSMSALPKRLKLPINDVRSAILSNPEFAAFQKTATKHFDDWRVATEKRLKAFDKEAHPKALIETPTLTR